MRWDCTGKITPREKALFSENGWFLQQDNRVVDFSFHDDNVNDTPTPLIIPGRLDNGIQVGDPLELGEKTPVLDNV